MAITIYSRKLDESFTFTMPSEGGYVRVSDGMGGYNQIFKRNGSAIIAHDELELRKVGRNYIRRVVAAEA